MYWVAQHLFWTVTVITNIPVVNPCPSGSIVTVPENSTFCLRGPLFFAAKSPYPKMRLFCWGRSRFIFSPFKAYGQWHANRNSATGFYMWRLSTSH